MRLPRAVPLRVPLVPGARRSSGIATRSQLSRGSRRAATLPGASGMRMSAVPRVRAAASRVLGGVLPRVSGMRIAGSARTAGAEHLPRTHPALMRPGPGLPGSGMLPPRAARAVSGKRASMSFASTRHPVLHHGNPGRPRRRVPSVLAAHSSTPSRKLPRTGRTLPAMIRWARAA